MPEEDKPLKSAYELAMERLNKRDAESGVSHHPLTDDQKAAIADIRNVYQAKIAELEVLHQSQLRKTFDPAERETIEAGFRRERDRLVSERDTKVEKARSGSR